MKARRQKAEGRGQAARLALEREIFYLKAVEERLEDIADFLEMAQGWVRSAIITGAEARRHESRGGGT